jgi:hypothetical protein
MGYASRYKIAEFLGPGTLVTDGRGGVPIAAEFIRAFDGSSEANDHTFRCVFGDEAWSWYEHERHIEDAMIVSGALLVVLHREGEEHGDVCDKRFTRTRDGAVVVEDRRYVLTPHSWQAMRKAGS